MQVDDSAIVAFDHDALILDDVVLGIQGDDVRNAEGLSGRQTVLLGEALSFW